MKRIVLIKGEPREIKDLQSVVVKAGVPFNCPSDEIADKLIRTGLFELAKTEKKEKSEGE